MKKLIFTLLALSLGLAACKKDDTVALESLTLDPASLTLEKGRTGQFKVQVSPAGVTEEYTIQWTTDNPDVAMVDKNTGKVTATGAGDATVTATTSTGKSAAGTVKVIVTATDFTIENTALSVNKDETVQIKVTTTPEDATTPVTFVSKDTGIATVDGKGTVTGVSLGATTIDVTVGSKTREVKVTVESPTEFSYAGETYKKLTLADGSVWMAEPLRFVPAGETPSAKPDDKNGIWFPYKIDGTSATALTDPESIRTYGYFYDWETALGAKIDKDNFKTFEGVQGICPDGWHVPTRTDCMALVGCSTKAVGEDSAPVNEDAVFYNKLYNGGNIKEMNEAGFNFSPSGCVLRPTMKAIGAYIAKPVANGANCSIEAFTGRPVLTYLICSTGYNFNVENDGSLSKLQFFGLMSTFNSTYKEGRLTCAYVNYVSGAPLRCVKNK